MNREEILNERCSSLLKLPDCDGESFDQTKEMVLLYSIEINEYFQLTVMFNSITAKHNNICKTKPKTIRIENYEGDIYKTFKDNYQFQENLSEEQLEDLVNLIESYVLINS